MKRKFWLIRFLFLSVALISLGLIACNTDTTDQSVTAKNTEEKLITVLNPEITTPMAERIPLTTRTDTLEGKTIYLVDLQWGGPEAGYSVFEEMKDWFSKNMPSVKVEVKRSKGGWMGDDPDLRAEIVERKAGGAVIGIGG